MSPLLAALALASFQQEEQARAQAEYLAACARLYEEYTGRAADSLERLRRRDEGIEFWPEGGFLLGEVPKDPWGGDYRIAGRSVVCSKEGIAAPLPPPSRTRIVPPNERLAAHYAALAHLRLIEARVRLILRSAGSLPKRREDLGPLPRGEYDIRFEAGYVLIQAADPAKRAVSLTREEQESLHAKAPVPLSPAEERKAKDALERMTDDDLAVREEASLELKALGRPVRPLLEERLRSEKDRYAKMWLERLRLEFPDEPESWETQMGPLSAYALTPKAETQLAQCTNQLTQLWTMENNYMVQFGGVRKIMPTETGKEFWLKLSKTSPPLIDETLAEIFVCPGSDVKPGEDVCTYYGPSANVNMYLDADPVGMCDDASHGGLVVVIFKSADVRIVPRGDPVEAEARKKTKR